MTVADISKMSLHERIQAMEALWDSLKGDPIGMKSPDWHGEILLERKEKIKEGKAAFISLEALKAKQAK